VTFDLHNLFVANKKGADRGRWLPFFDCALGGGGGCGNRSSSGFRNRGDIFKISKYNIGCMQQPVGQTLNGGAGTNGPRWRRPCVDPILP